MRSAARIVVRLAVVGAAGAILGLALRAPLERAFTRAIEGPFAPHDGSHMEEPTLPPPTGSPASSSDRDGGTPRLVVPGPVESNAPAPPKAPPKKRAPLVIERGPPGGAPVVRVTRAEIDDAIATGLDGATAEIANDEEGKPLGLALHRVGRLAPLGVREGDVLVSANGRPLTTPEQAAAAIGALRGADRVTFGLRRGGAPHQPYAVVVEVVP